MNEGEELQHLTELNFFNKMQKNGFNKVNIEYILSSLYRRNPAKTPLVFTSQEIQKVMRFLLFCLFETTKVVFSLHTKSLLCAIHFYYFRILIQRISTYRKENI